MSTGLQNLLRIQPDYQPTFNVYIEESAMPSQPEQQTISGLYGNLSDMANVSYEAYYDLYSKHYGLRRESFYNALLRITPEGRQLDLADSYYGYLRRRLNASSEAVRSAVDMNLQIMHGNPVFRGTRIPIYQIIEELADGTPLAEIPEGYPSLGTDQIQRGLDFAASILRIYDDQVSDR